MTSNNIYSMTAKAVHIKTSRVTAKEMHIKASRLWKSSAHLDKCATAKTVYFFKNRDKIICNKHQCRQWWSD